MKKYKARKISELELMAWKLSYQGPSQKYLAGDPAKNILQGERTTEKGLKMSQR